MTLYVRLEAVLNVDMWSRVNMQQEKLHRAERVYFLSLRCGAFSGGNGHGTFIVKRGAEALAETIKAEILGGS